MTRQTVEAIARLRERFGDKISVADAVRAHHASGGVEAHMHVAHFDDRAHPSTGTLV